MSSAPGGIRKSHRRADDKAAAVGEVAALEAWTRIALRELTVAPARQSAVDVAITLEQAPALGGQGASVRAIATPMERSMRVLA